MLIQLLAAALCMASAFSAQPKKADAPVTLLAVGDILLARGVGRAIAAHGATYPFAPTKNLVRKADIAVFNLECVLSKRGFPQHERYQFRADPALAGTLAADGFNVAILANNHTLDYGREPLMDTVEAVRKAGMLAVGAGKNRENAAALRIVVKKGLKVGFLAFTDMPNVGVVRRNDAPTVAGVNDYTLAQEVKAARTRCDTLIVFFHWGVEYMKIPTERQQALARKCIDAGADLVLGCHPHVLQTLEVYKGKQIVYSMGGFVFDSGVFGSDKGAMFFFELRAGSARLVRVVHTLMKGGRTVPVQENRKVGRLRTRHAPKSRTNA